MKCIFILSLITFIYYLVVLYLIILDLTTITGDDPIFENKKQVLKTLLPFLYIKKWWNDLE